MKEPKASELWLIAQQKMEECEKHLGETLKYLGKVSVDWNEFKEQLKERDE